MQQIRESPKIPKSAIYIYIDGNTNYFSWATSGSIFSIEIFSEETAAVDQSFSLSSEFWLSKNPEKTFSLNISRYLNSFSLVNQNYRLWFFYKSRNQKPSSCRNIFDETIPKFFRALERGLSDFPNKVDYNVWYR